MTLQELFDLNYCHFVYGGGKPSVDEYGSCLYRGPNGTKCAIGMAIPDSMYEEGMECGPLLCLTARYPDVGRIFDGIAEEDLTELQRCHDRAARKCDAYGELLPMSDGEFVQGFKRRMEEFAKPRNLTIPQP